MKNILQARVVVVVVFMTDAARLLHHFSVDVGVIRPWEYVFVTGSIEKLGLWRPQNALQLAPELDNPERWSGCVETDGIPFDFRYFVGYFLESGKEENSRELIVRRWETFLKPRNSESKLDQHLHRSHADTFGINAGKQLISEGWLASENQNEILIRIHGEPFKFYKRRHADRSYRIRVTPFDLRHREVGSIDDDVEDAQDSLLLPTLPSFSSTDLAVLSAEDPLYHEQLINGEHFKNGSDYFVFRTISVAVDFLGFRIELFVHDDSGDGKECMERFAIAFALPSSFPDTCGVASLPLLAKSHRPIGQLIVDYLYIKSLSKCEVPMNMSISYGRHWKKRKTIEVGHRGMGNSYTKSAAGRENTIDSLNKAAKNGADYVEFDVQLTRDKVAVIYHDFHVLVSVARRHGSHADMARIKESESANEYYQLAVKDLKLQQLHLLHLDHYTAANGVTRPGLLKVTGEADEALDLRPFPRLVDALRQVDPSAGFNIEVKYPMMQKDGTHECENYFERNEHVDIILRDVLANAEGRRIVFSSFDPDVCAMIAAKQNIYPVQFLCVGVTTRYVPFVDLRASTSLAAVNFAASINILGVNFHSEDLLKDPSPVRRASKFRLISFVWGDDLDSKENIEYFRKELLVDGLIYDRIGEIEARRNVFLVEKEAKAALLRKSLSPTASRVVSLDKPINSPPSPTFSEASSTISSVTLSPNHSPY